MIVKRPAKKIVFTLAGSAKSCIIWGNFLKGVFLLDAASIASLSLTHRQPRNVVSFILFCEIYLP